MITIEDYSKRSDILKKRAERLLSEAGYENVFERNEDDTISIVFAGQYSAGKSSILKMLTGDNSIAIGGGITTEVTNEYDWNGLKIIDTPGIQTGLRPDHDEISYNAIAKADILVFVVTNELFDDYMGKHFRKLAIDKDKAGEMILVVNKMEREENGNTTVSQKVKRDDLVKVLYPYSPEQLNVCFLDAKSYLDGLEESDNDKEYSNELIELSGYDQFVSVLNCFVAKHGIAGKLTTLLYQIDSKIQEALKVLEPNSNEDIRALEEQFLQQRQILTEARFQMQNELKDRFLESTTEIRDMGLEIANEISENIDIESAEAKLEEAQDKVERITEICQREAHEIVVSKLNEVEKAIDDLENTEFSCNLKARLSDRFSKLPEKIKDVLNQASGSVQAAGRKVVNAAYRNGVNGGLKLSNFAGGSVHKMVKEVGHMVGYKFKPWQAVKVARGVAIAGHVLSAFGVVLSLGMQVKEDYDDAKKREQMKENRQNIRSSFNSVAKEFDEFAKKYIRNVTSLTLDKYISEIDKNLGIIRSTRTERSQSYRQLEMLQGDCVSLIQEIHSSISLS